MPTSGQTASDHFEAVVRFMRRAVRFWRVSLVVFAIGIAATAAVDKLRPKRYRSDAVVHYREGLQWSTHEGASARRVGQRLKDYLLARAQLTIVIDELKLYPELVKAGRLADAIEEMRLAITFKIG